MDASTQWDAGVKKTSLIPSIHQDSYSFVCGMGCVYFLSASMVSMKEDFYEEEDDVHAIEETGLHACRCNCIASVWRVCTICCIKGPSVICKDGSVISS